MDVVTRLQYLMRKAVMEGASVFVAYEAVHSVALEHPEWDLNEERTWEEWEQGEAGVDRPH